LQNKLTVNSVERVSKGLFLASRHDFNSLP